MKNKKILWGLFLFLQVFSILMVSSLTSTNITWVSPSASSSFSGTGILNISLDSVIGAENWTNAKFYALSSSTANSSWVLLGSFANSTSTVFNGTFVSSILQDSNDYQFNVTISNGTSKIDKLITGITLDNFVPQTPTISPDDTVITTSTDQTFTGTVVDANTTSCTYTISRGGATSGIDYIVGSGTYSGSSCTFTKSFSSTVDNGIWYWKITASDGTNSSSSAENTYEVRFAGSGGGLTQGAIDKATGSNNFWFWAIIIAMIIIFFILVKKRR